MAPTMAAINPPAGASYALYKVIASEPERVTVNVPFMVVVKLPNLPVICRVPDMLLPVTVALPPPVKDKPLCMNGVIVNVN